MTRALALAVLAAVTTACGHAGGHPAAASAAQTAPAPEGRGGMAMPCPVAVPGTQVAVGDTPDGVAVTFTTTPDRTAELRARVHAMADMHNRHHQGAGMEHGAMERGEMHRGAMMGGGMMGSGGGEAMPMMPPPSRATVDDVDGGARLAVSPNDPADLDRLRSTVRMHAEHMQRSGSCDEHGGR